MRAMREGSVLGPLSLAYRQSSSVFSYGLPSLYISVQISSSLKDTNHIALGPTLMISF